jgi:hypothetical protein
MLETPNVSSREAPSHWHHRIPGLAERGSRDRYSIDVHTYIAVSDSYRRDMIVVIVMS